MRSTTDRVVVVQSVEVECASVGLVGGRKRILAGSTVTQLRGVLRPV